MKYICSLLLYTFCCFSVSANEGEMKVATYIEPPFVELIDNKLVGEHVEIAKLLAKASNLKPVFIRCPFARCLNMVKQGKADIIFGVRKSPEREKALTYINPPYMVQTYPLRVFTLASKSIAINSFKDLEGLTLGTLRGGSYFTLFDENKSITKVELISRKQLVDMLLRDRIDAFIEREQSIIPLVSKEVYQQKLLLANYSYNEAVNSFVAISKKSHIKNHSKLLSKQLQILVTNGTINKIIMKQRNDIKRVNYDRITKSDGKKSPL